MAATATVAGVCTLAHPPAEQAASGPWRLWSSKAKMARCTDARRMGVRSPRLIMVSRTAQMASAAMQGLMSVKALDFLAETPMQRVADQVQGRAQAQALWIEIREESCD